MTEHTHHALIVEDDAKIVDVVTDHIESLGHGCDCAANQAEARELLAARKYCYVLLDLEIPVKPKRMARKEYGINLLEEIRRRAETCRTIVIIMTSHGTDGPYLAVEMMKKGADDYICKPFNSGPGGRAPTDVIKQALQKGCKHSPGHCPVLAGGESAPQASQTSDPAEPTPFEGGELVFHDDRVELLGHTILTDKGNDFSRRLLDLLAQRKPSGEYKAYSGKKLAQHLDSLGQKGQNDVAGYVKYLRDQITSVLGKAGVSCERHDVIESGGRGYRLNPWIDVEGIDG